MIPETACESRLLSKKMIRVMRMRVMLMVMKMARVMRMMLMVIDKDVEGDDDADNVDRESMRVMISMSLVGDNEVRYTTQPLWSVD